MSLLDIKHAKEALAWRLKEWGVENHHALAASFIDDLVTKGWQMDPQREARPQPPTRADECPRHAGQWEMRCGACAIERRVRSDDDSNGPRLSRDEALAAAREALAAAKRTAPTDEETADV